MTADNLIQFLQQPEGLRRVSYQELKTLALEYPFCPHVHQLLLFKSRLEGHKDFQADLGRAAAHSIDRAFLRRRLQELDASLLHAEAPLHEEFFELKPLAELEQRLANAREPVSVEKPVEAAPPREAPATAPVEKSSPAPRGKEELPGEHTPAPGMRDSRPAENQATVSGEAPEVSGEGTEALLPVEGALYAEGDTPVPEPMPKSQFRSWKRRHVPGPLPIVPLSPTTSDSPAGKEETLAVQEPETGYNLPDLRDMAERSVEEKEEVASETLAELLARQGHIAKAVEMYNRLCLLFPEKSAYFAARIQNLKNN